METRHMTNQQHQLRALQYLYNRQPKTNVMRMSGFEINFCLPVVDYIHYTVLTL